MGIVEWKESHVLTKNFIATFQFIWVAFNNVTAVMGYFVLLFVIQPFKEAACSKSIDKTYIFIEKTTKFR